MCRVGRDILLQRGEVQAAVAYRGGVWGCSNSPPPTEILKALQNRAILKPIVKIVKNC